MIHKCMWRLCYVLYGVLIYIYIYTHTHTFLYIRSALNLIQFDRGDPVHPERPRCRGAPAEARGCRARDAGHRQQLRRMHARTPADL